MVQDNSSPDDPACLTASHFPSSLVITIDGPAGAGKSTVARMLAEHLKFEFLDTGAMYRCITLAVLREGLSITDNEAIEELARRTSIELVGSQVLLNGENVSEEIRTPKVASAIGMIADNVAVRSMLTRLQRNWTEGKRVVTEGRDQGTEVFPNSPCKIFLVASNIERARRRVSELVERGIDVHFESVLRQQEKRDTEDRSREVGALRKAPDAIEICTNGLSLEEVVQQLLNIVNSRFRIASTEQGEVK